MTNQTTARKSTSSYIFSTEKGAQEFRDYATSLTEVAWSMNPVRDGLVELKKVVVREVPSLLFNLSLRTDLDRKYEDIVLREQIEHLRSRIDFLLKRAKDCSEKDEPLSDQLFNKAKELEEALKKLMEGSQQ